MPPHRVILKNKYINIQEALRTANTKNNLLLLCHELMLNSISTWYDQNVISYLAPELYPFKRNV